MRAALIALGAVVMGYAVLGAASDPGLKPGGVVLFLAAVLVGHDAVLLPVTIAVGALIGRFAPRWTRPSIRAAAIVSLAVGVVALPLVLGYGRSADNPSVLPLAYGRGLVLLLLAVWAAALISAVLARRHLQPALARPADSGMQNRSGRAPIGGRPAGQPSAGAARAERSPVAGSPGDGQAEETSSSGPSGITQAQGPPVGRPPTRAQTEGPPVVRPPGSAQTGEPPADGPRGGRQ